MEDARERIHAFLAKGPWAVVGASKDRSKYGNKVLRAYLQNDREVYPVHPKEQEIEGQRCYPRLGDLPVAVHGVSIVTPPAVTLGVVKEAAAAGAHHVWMQPGAESDAAIEEARALNLEVIAGGPCVLVALGYREAD